MLMLSIKNTMGVAATVYAADSVTRVVMDLVPQEVKEDLNSAFDYAYKSITKISVRME